MFERYYRELLGFLANKVRDRDVASDLAHADLRELLEGRLKQMRKMYGFPMVVVADQSEAAEKAQGFLRD